VIFIASNEIHKVTTKHSFDSEVWIIEKTFSLFDGVQSDQLVGQLSERFEGL